MMTTTTTSFDVPTMELLGRIGLLRAGRMSLEAFREWFTPRSWERMEDDAAFAQVELGLAEFTSGHSSTTELLHDLRKLAELDDAVVIGLPARIAADAQTFWTLDEAMNPLPTGAEPSEALSNSGLVIDRSYEPRYEYSQPRDRYQDSVSLTVAA